MHKKVQTFSRIQKHLISILLSVFCMAAAAVFSSICSHVFNRFSLSCILVFVPFIILASCRTADRLYGILCSGAGTAVDFIVEDHSDCVSFTIREYGNSISKNMLEHLFEGTDYTASVSDVKKGMGIGLVICKTIITAHHGTITGRNHPGGAEFVFTLPKRKEDHHESQNKRPSD